MNLGTATLAALIACSFALGVAGCAESMGTSPDFACYGLAVVFLLSGIGIGRRLV